MLDIQTRQLPPDITVIEITGKITIGRDCQHLEWTAENLVRDKKNKIIFDLSGVTHIDSTGIGIIVMAAGEAKESGGQLRLAGVNGHLEHLLKVTSIDKVVAWDPTVREAAAAFQA